ncbi:MAG: sodium:calcium antiporter [Planctomycetota bacterium]
MKRAPLSLGLALSLVAPAIWFRLMGIEMAKEGYLLLHGIHESATWHPAVGIVVFGAGIVAAAFLISWACELAQLEVSQSLALATVALVSILPEYAVDLYFAWTAATVPENLDFALANMTGANRLLVGLGWPLVGFLIYLKRRHHRVVLRHTQGPESLYLGIATIYCFFIVAKRSLSVLDTAFLFILFGFYIRFASRQKVLEPELMGAAALIGGLPRRRRASCTIAMFIYSGVGIFCCAEPFAESLVSGGKSLGIHPSYLVQWLAPLASEAPEFIIAVLLAARGYASMGLGILISSKVNQWSLLVGCVPLVYAIALLVHGQDIAAMGLSQRQFGELLLTGAQSYFAVAVILDLCFTLRDAVALAVLFLAQLAFTITVESICPQQVADPILYGEKLVFSAIYIIFGSYFLWQNRWSLPGLSRRAFK